MKNKKQIIFIMLAILITVMAVILYPKKTNRYAIFAGYNANQTISDYVITYLKGLNEVTDGVIYIADSELKEEEYSKIKDLVIHTEHKRHNEYDWGSYKRGFNWLKEHDYLEKAEELIFANDSCYAPMKSFKPMFETMKKRKELNFWGDLQNTVFTNHIQSYFIVLRKPIIRSKAFQQFINSVTHQEYSSMYITEYEVKLTPMLENLGYKWDSYMPYDKLQHLELGDKNSYPLTIIKDFNHQFLKRRTFTTNLPIMESKEELLDYIKTTYPKRYEEIIKEIKPIPNKETN